MIELLGQAGARPGEQALRAIIERTDEPQAVQLAALSALASFDRPDVADAVLSHYAAWPEGLRARALDVLCARKSSARQLVETIESGRIAAKDLKPAHVLQIVQLGDESMTARIERAWGRVPVANSEEKRQRIAEVRGMLPEGDKGNATRGRAIFTKHCAVCHRLFGEGETFGPDLTGTERGNLEFLLASVVDPGALIRKEYAAQTVALADGRVLTGLVVEENETALTLFDSQRQKTILTKADIEEVRPATTSVMPDGLLDPLPENEIRDLFRYLQSSGPPGS
jgi:putative heme-binding domain-containing protein